MYVELQELSKNEQNKLILNYHAAVNQIYWAIWLLTCKNKCKYTYIPV